MRWAPLLAALCLAVPAAAAERSVSAELMRLHDDLHLTSAQDAAWRAYSIAVAPNPQAQARRRAADAMMPNLPTPRRIALMEAAMLDDLADFRREGAAVTAFYRQLSPDQRRIFDRETLPINRSAPVSAAPSP